VILFRKKDLNLFMYEPEIRAYLNFVSTGS